MSARLTDPTWTLDDALRLLHLDAGHDYHGRHAVDGRTVSVEGIGIDGSLLALLHERLGHRYVIVEQQRIPAARRRSDNDWIRVDVHEKVSP